MSGRDIIEFEGRLVRDIIGENYITFKFNGRNVAIPRSQYWGKTQKGPISDNFVVKIPKWLAKKKGII